MISKREEADARLKAARKMGLVKDLKGENLPDDLWMQALPPARLAGEIVRLRAELRLAKERREPLALYGPGEIADPLA